LQTPGLRHRSSRTQWYKRHRPPDVGQNKFIGSDRGETGVATGSNVHLHNIYSLHITTSTCTRVAEIEPQKVPSLIHPTLPSINQLDLHFPQLHVSLHRQKRQTPQLPHVRLRRIHARRWRQRSQRCETEVPVFVNPAPDFRAQNVCVGFDRVP
jgi:hypothetical protein